MNANEMSNEELALNIEYTADELPNYGGFECADELYEAAKRLRRLKVAGDALIDLLDIICVGCNIADKRTGRCVGCGRVVKARKALAAIREEGGANESD